MTNSDEAIRDIAEKTFPLDTEELYNSLQRLYRSELIERITALISEHYYPKEKYDELLQQRDELREALEHIAEYWNRDRNDEAMHNALWEIINTAEAAIKNTER